LRKSRSNKNAVAASATNHRVSGLVQRIYGWTEAQAIKLGMQDLVPAALIDETTARLRQLSHANVLGPVQTQRLTRSGETVAISLIATALRDAAGKVYAVSSTERLQETTAD